MQTATESVTPARPDRRERLINLIPVVYERVRAADVFTDRGHELAARMFRWLRRNGLTLDGAEGG